MNVTEGWAGYQIQTSGLGSLCAYTSIFPYSPLKLIPLTAVKSWALWYCVGVHESGNKAVLGAGINCTCGEMALLKWLASVYRIASLSLDTFD